MATITITLNPDKSITYSDPKPITKPGEDIEWVCKGGKGFAVHFVNLTPVDKVRCRSGNGERVSKKINTTNSGVYKYFVAVVDEDFNIYTDDPEIIVGGGG
jgi:plastocyanin